MPAIGRITIFWDSPIVAGVMVALILPWLRVIMEPKRGNRRGIILWGALLLAECLGVVILTLTQSRGPIIAAAVGYVVSAIVYFRVRRTTFGCVRCALLASLLLVLCSQSGVRERLDPRSMREDGSVLNRLEVWKGAVEMLSLSPLTGIGSGESGYIFSQWYQPEHLSYSYTGLLNSYLELGVEHGCLALFLMVAAALLVVATPWCLFESLDRGALVDRGSILLSAYASLMTLVVASLTTSYQGYPSVLATAFISAVMIAFGYSRIGKEQLLRRLLTAFGSSVMIIMVLLAVSNSRAAQRPYRLSIVPGFGVWLAKQPSNGSATIGISLIDRKVLGRLYGRSLRKWLAAYSNVSIVHVPDPRRPVPRGAETHPYDAGYIFGDCCRIYGEVNFAEEAVVTFIFPSAEPPLDLIKNARVVIPVLDLQNLRPKWAQVAGFKPDRDWLELGLSDGAAQVR
jgi:hypothetical protein